MPLWLRFTIFFTTLFIAIVALNVYVYRRASFVLRLERRGKIALGATLVAGVAAMIAGRLFDAGAESAVAEALIVSGAAIQLGVVIAAILMLPVDAVRGAIALVRRAAGFGSSRAERAPAETEQLAADGGDVESVPAEARETTDLSRRDFVLRSAYGSALAVGGGASLYGSFFGRHDYVIEDVPVALPGLPATLDGYTIVQLSDIHFGRFVGIQEIHAAIEMVRRARPDMIVLTGDLIDHDASFAPLLGQLVRRLEPLARDGVVAIPGNHDYYAGIDVVLGTLHRAGAKVLRNQGRVVGDASGGFALLGVDDVWGPRNGVGPGADLARAIRMVPPDLPRVLLCHNPEFFPDASPHVQLQLSGHTHGGQVNLGIRPADLVLPHGYVAGAYERDGAHLWINRGFGTAGPPARVDAPPEITRIVLTRA